MKCSQPTLPNEVPPVAPLLARAVSPLLELATPLALPVTSATFRLTRLRLVFRVVISWLEAVVESVRPSVGIGLAPFPELISLIRKRLFHNLYFTLLHSLV